MSLERSLNLPAPELTPLFSAEMEKGESYDFGNTPDGKYEACSYSSGAFTGNRLSGTLLDCSGNWKTTRADGVVTVNAKYMLKTDTGDIISIESSGSSVESGKGTAYFHERLFFKAGSPKYSWLNDTVAIGFVRESDDNKVMLDAFLIN